MAGFYAMNSHAVTSEELPKLAKLKNWPHEHIGAAYLSMFGVDKKFQGQRLGTSLVADAISRVAKISNEIGIKVLILDVLNDDGPENTAKRLDFYRRFGFISFPSNELKMFLPIEDARRFLAGL